MSPLSRCSLKLVIVLSVCVFGEPAYGQAQGLDGQPNAAPPTGARVAHGPYSLTVYMNRATAWLNNGPLDRAEDRVARNLAEYVYEPDRRKALAITKACEALTIGLHLHPNAEANYLAHALKGALLVAMSQHDEAMESFKEAVRIWPTDPNRTRYEDPVSLGNVCFQMGVCLLQNKRNANAMEWFRSAAEFNPARQKDVAILEETIGQPTFDMGRLSQVAFGGLLQSGSSGPAPRWRRVEQRVACPACAGSATGFSPGPCNDCGGSRERAVIVWEMY